jgi:PAS domain S-box-containing protein
MNKKSITNIKFKSKTKEELISEIDRLNKVISKLHDYHLERGQSESRQFHLATFPELNPNPIIEIDHTGNLIYFNESAINTLREIGVTEDISLYYDFNLNPYLIKLSNNESSRHYLEIQIGDHVFSEYIYLFPSLKTLRIYVIDITERSNYEKALKISEEKFSKAFQVSPDAISISRLKDGVYLNVNEGFSKITGYSHNDVMGISALELGIWVNEKDRDFVVSVLKEKGEILEFESQFRKKDGKIVSGLLSGKIIEFNNERCLLAITRDITKWNEIISMLSIFRLAADSSNEIIFITDKTGIFTFVNREFEKVYGYSKSEVIGKLTPRILKSDSKSNMKFNEFWKTLVEKNSIMASFRNMCKSGKFVNVECSANAIFDDDNNVLGFLAIQHILKS